jgi:hypothetical protein
MRVADVPPALRQRLGPEASDGLLAAFDQAKQEWMEDAMTQSVDRFERRLAEEMAAMRAELRTALAEQGAALRTEIAASRTDIVRWLFLFWTGQVVALAALLSARR